MLECMDRKCYCPRLLRADKPRHGGDCIETYSCRRRRASANRALTLSSRSFVEPADVENAHRAYKVCIARCMLLQIADILLPGFVSAKSPTNDSDGALWIVSATCTIRVAMIPPGTPRLATAVSYSV